MRPLPAIPHHVIDKWNHEIAEGLRRVDDGDRIAQEAEVVRAIAEGALTLDQGAAYVAFARQQVEAPDRPTRLLRGRLGEFEAVGSASEDSVGELKELLRSVREELPFGHPFGRALTPTAWASPPARCADMVTDPESQPEALYRAAVMTQGAGYSIGRVVLESLTRGVPAGPFAEDALTRFTSASPEVVLFSAQCQRVIDALQDVTGRKSQLIALSQAAGIFIALSAIEGKTGEAAQQEADMIFRAGILDPEYAARLVPEILSRLKNLRVLSEPETQVP